ncbi:GNAT family N-acetyltransferase [Isoptericola halotolerans]
MLRQPEPRDRPAIVELHASPQVGRYIGGARPRDELERSVSEAPSGRPGQFVVDLAGAMIGLVQLVRRDAAHEEGPTAGRVDLGYLFLPHVWGHGYATEACTAALDWLDRVLPDERVVLSTQVANQRSMRLAERLGFTEIERLEAHGAEQWFGERPPGGGPGAEARAPGRLDVR